MIWWMAVAGAGACDRCSWTLEYVEVADAGTSSGSAGSGGDTRVGTGGEGTGAVSGSGDAGSTGAVGEGGEGEGGGSEDGASSGDGATDTGGAGSSSSSSSSGAEASGADDLGTMLELCGNNLLDRGEACDDGNLADDDACPSGLGGCVAEATCGDGFIFAGKEDCEDGNIDDTDECSNSCWLKRRVFVTQEAYSGDLGGVVGADEKCAEAAVKAGLEGVFRAWISDDGFGPAVRFNSADFRGWYVLTTGEALAYGWEDLTDGEPLLKPIAVSEYEAALPPINDFAWTNTGSGGHSAHAADCASWSQPGSGHVGRFTSMSSEWTSYTERDCLGTVAHLYCFQVAQPQN